MLSKSIGHNPNYLAKVIRLRNLEKVPNSDFLQMTHIDFQPIVTGLDAKEGDLYVYFPAESKLNHEFLSKTNSFRHPELNEDREAKGFFDDNGRVRAVRLRKQDSIGYIVPVKTVFDWAEDNTEPVEGEEFDTINNKLLLEKYVVRRNQSSGKGNRSHKKAVANRLVENQVNLHVNTLNLRRNAMGIRPDDVISLTAKFHGTSFTLQNVLVKKKVGIFSRISKFMGVKIQETEYDLLYTSRKVVKNRAYQDPKNTNHYYDVDIWGTVQQEIGDKVPKGFCLYGEIVGYLPKSTKMIQKDYDYGCKVGQHKTMIYRITQVNADGVVTELSWPEVLEFCERHALTPVPTFYYGLAKDKYPDLNVEDHWNESFIEKLQEEYNEKDCQYCDNKVPEEGIVIKRDSLYHCNPFKLKSYNFLKRETEELDLEEQNIEEVS